MKALFYFELRVSAGIIENLKTRDITLLPTIFRSTLEAKCQGSFITSVYRKKTYTGLLTNYFSFTPFKYKLGLIKTLIDRAYKINNTTQGFHNDIKNFSEILKRNMFPKWLIDKSVKGFLSKVTTTGKDASKCETSNCHFYKLPYIGYYSSYTGRKISSIVNKYCKDLNVKIIFSPFKLSTMFSPKDFIPDSLKHVLFISLHVRAVEFVILVKPIDILTHVLMSIYFGTKIPTFLNILVLLKIVGISVISLVLRFSIMPALTLNSK